MSTKGPTHEEISLRAWSLWQANGCPVGRDEEFWFDAERELTTPTAASNVPSATDGRGNGNSQIGRSEADPKASDLKPQEGKSGNQRKEGESEAERLKGEMASESAVEYHISPPVPDEEAIKSALQTRDARSPQRPTKQAPRPKPTESGKPLYSRPHSS